jgi:tetrahydrodipicolinate N-succinyltransferase
LEAGKLVIMDTLCAQTGQGEELIEDRGLLEDEEHREAVFDTVAALDRGELRVAQKEDGEWRSNAWVMKAISLYFVVAGTRNKVFLAGSYQLQPALIIGQRRESTDQKTSLNEALRQFGVSFEGAPARRSALVSRAPERDRRGEAPV